MKLKNYFFPFLIVIFFAVIAISIKACGKKDKDENSKPTPKPEPTKEEIYLQKVNDVIETKLVNEWVNASMIDSAKFIANAPCPQATRIYNAILKSTKDRDGAFVWADPIPVDRQGGKENTIKGEIAMAYGLLSYHKNCKADDVPELFKKHVDFVVRSKYEIYPGTFITYPEDLKYLLFNTFTENPGPHDLDARIKKSLTDNPDESIMLILIAGNILEETKTYVCENGKTDEIKFWCNGDNLGLKLAFITGLNENTKN